MKISVVVKFEKRKEKVDKVNENTYNIYVKSSPKQGKANEEIVKELAKYFQTSVDSIKIVSGVKDRKKEILVRLIDKT